jgi:hypothetical protein
MKYEMGTACSKYGGKRYPTLYKEAVEAQSKASAQREKQQQV